MEIGNEFVMNFDFEWSGLQGTANSSEEYKAPMKNMMDANESGHGVTIKLLICVK